MEAKRPRAGGILSTSRGYKERKGNPDDLVIKGTKETLGDLVIRETKGIPERKVTREILGDPAIRGTKGIPEYKEFPDRKEILANEANAGSEASKANAENKASRASLALKGSLALLKNRESLALLGLPESLSVDYIPVMENRSIR